VLQLLHQSLFAPSIDSFVEHIEHLLFTINGRMQLRDENI